MTELRAIPDELVTRFQLAEYLAVSVRTVDQWRSEGMPCVPLGRRLIRFKVAECMRWLETYPERKAA